MRSLYLKINVLIALCFFKSFSQVNISEDFESTPLNYNWTEDNSIINQSINNPLINTDNPSAKVLRYEDFGNAYANVYFNYGQNFDLSAAHEFSVLIYVPSSNIQVIRQIKFL